MRLGLAQAKNDVQVMREHVMCLVEVGARFQHLKQGAVSSTGTRNGEWPWMLVERRAGQHPRWHTDQVGPVPTRGRISVIVLRHSRQSEL